MPITLSHYKTSLSGYIAYCLHFSPLPTKIWAPWFLFLSMIWPSTKEHWGVITRMGEWVPGKQINCSVCKETASQRPRPREVSWSVWGHKCDWGRAGPLALGPCWSQSASERAHWGHLSSLLLLNKPRSLATPEDVDLLFSMTLVKQQIPQQFGKSVFQKHHSCLNYWPEFDCDSSEKGKKRGGGCFLKNWFFNDPEPQMCGPTRTGDPKLIACSWRRMFLANI